MKKIVVVSGLASYTFTSWKSHEGVSESFSNTACINMTASQHFSANTKSKSEIICIVEQCIV